MDKQDQDRQQQALDGYLKALDSLLNDPERQRREEEMMSRALEEVRQEMRGTFFSDRAEAPSQSGRTSPRRPEPPHWSTLLKAPTCQDCGRDTVLKKGRHGYFWSCTGYPGKCRGALPLRSGQAWDLKLGRFPIIPPEEFAGSEPFRFVVEWQTTAPRWARGAIQSVVESVAEGALAGLVYTGEASTLLDCLHKDGQKLRLAQWAHFFYQVEGGSLPEKLDYWLNQVYDPESPLAEVGHTEAQVEAAIVAAWSDTPFAGFKLIGAQLVISPEGAITPRTPFQTGACPDILARSTDGQLVVIEVKGPGRNHRSGVRQIREYRDEAKRVSGEASGYIVAPGFPRNIRAEGFGLIGYVIQDGRLYLIPWTSGDFV